MTFASTEAPNVVSQAIKEADDSSVTISKLRKDSEKIGGEVKLHMAEVGDLNKKLSVLTGQIAELERYSTYLQIVGQCQDLRYGI